MARIEWSKGWEDELARQMRAEMQAACDAVHRQCAGHPVEHVKEGLQREFKRRDAALSDPELTQFAEIISSGAQVKFTP